MTMKTLLFSLYTFAVTIGAATVSGQPFGLGPLFAALAVAALFAVALNDSPKAMPPLRRARVTRFPARPIARLPERTHAFDLAA
jgi:hypothetical protein